MVRYHHLWGGRDVSAAHHAFVDTATHEAWSALGTAASSVSVTDVELGLGSHKFATAMSQRRTPVVPQAEPADGGTCPPCWLMICLISAAITPSTLSKLVTLPATPRGIGVGTYAVPAGFSWKA